MNDKNAGVVPLDEERRRRQLKAEGGAGVDDLQHLDSAGAMLGAARHARGLSVEEVGARTNIPTERVIALEEMRFEDLPSAPFTLGFVRTYASLLDLPVDPLVERFRTEAGYPGAAYVPRLSPKLDRDLGPPPQVSLFAVMVVICVIGYVVWQILQSVATDEEIAPPDGFPLALNEEVETPVVYEAEASLVENPAVSPVEENVSAAEPADGSETAATPDDGLTEIERLQASIEADDPMMLVQSPRLPRVKPTPQERVEATEARRLAALEAARLAAELAEQEEGAEALEAQNSDDGEALTVDFDSELAAEGGTEDAPDLTLPEALQDSSSGALPSETPPTEASTTDDAPIEETTETAAALESVVEPVRTLAVPPVYPVRCESGASDREVVTISYRVSRFGKVVGPEVSDTTNTCFNRAALSAVARWNFTPAQSGGEAVASETQSTRIVFRRPE